jgi:hypothetical protein
MSIEGKSDWCDNQLQIKAFLSFLFMHHDQHSPGKTIQVRAL